MSAANKPSQNSKKNTQTTENVTLKDALTEDNKEVEFLKKSIDDLTTQLTDTRNQLRELTGEKTTDSKSSRAIEFVKNNPEIIEELSKRYGLNPIQESDL